MKKNNWIVITGAPGSGKTTTINLLSKKGYKITQEAARRYYEEQMAMGFTNEQIKSDSQKLQDSIARMVIKIEKELNASDTVFLDRGIPDNFAYYEYFNIKAPKFIVDAYKESNYNKVFYLEIVSREKDPVRIESRKQIEYLARLTRQYYENKKINLITIPSMSVEERVKLILKNAGL